MFKGLNIVICLMISLITASQGQITRHFEVREKNGINLVELNFSCYKGVTELSRAYNGLPFQAQADLGKVNILPSFNHHLKDGILITHLEHKNIESESLSKNLSYRFFFK